MTIRTSSNSRFMAALLEQSPVPPASTHRGAATRNLGHDWVHGELRGELYHTRAGSRFQGVREARAAQPRAVSRASSSRSWIPPKPPFERMATRSPGRSAPARRATISSTPGRTSASRPRARIESTSSASESRCSSGTLSRQMGRRHHDPVRPAEGPREVLLEQARARGEGARLEHRDQPSRRALGQSSASTGSGRPQGLERRPHRGRVVGEVVVDGDAPATRPRTSRRRSDAPEGGQRATAAPPARPPRPRPRPGRPGRCARCAPRPGHRRTSPRSRSRRQQAKPRAVALRAELGRPPVGLVVRARTSRPGSGPSAGSRRSAGLSAPARSEPAARDHVQQPDEGRLRPRRGRGRCRRGRTRGSR